MIITTSFAKWLTKGSTPALNVTVPNFESRYLTLVEAHHSSGYKMLFSLLYIKVASLWNYQIWLTEQCYYY